MKKSRIEQLLPIGSVVFVKDVDKMIMIVARMQKAMKTGNYYDYGACYYPEGLLKSDQLLLFQHQDIEEIVVKGYEDQQEASFKKSILEALRVNKMLD